MERQDVAPFSAVNPQDGMEALCGKTYKLCGKEITLNNAALMFVVRAGFQIESMEKNFMEIVPVAAFAMVHQKEAISMLGASSHEIRLAAAKFAIEELSIEDLGIATAMFQDAVIRFNRAFTQFAAESKNGGNAGNVVASAVSS